MVVDLVRLFCLKMGMISFLCFTSLSPRCSVDRKRRCGDSFGIHLCRRDEKWFAALFLFFLPVFFLLGFLSWYLSLSILLLSCSVRFWKKLCPFAFHRSLKDTNQTALKALRGFVSFSIGQKDAKPRNGRTNDVLVCVGPTYDCCLLLFYLFASVCFRCCSFGFVHFGKLFFLFFVIRVTCFASCSVDRKRRERKTR